jgi:hypothetical protein
MIEASAIDAHAIQGYYTGALARAVDMTVAARLEGDSVLIEAMPRNLAASAAA